MEGDNNSSSSSTLHVVRAAELFPKSPPEKDDEKLKIPLTELSGEFVRYLGRTEDSVLALSNYRLFLLKNSNSAETSVPIGLIESAIIRDLFQLIISCKDCSTIKCSFTTSEQSVEWQRRITLSVGIPNNLESLFAFPFYAWASEEYPPFQSSINSDNGNNINLNNGNVTNEWTGRLQRATNSDDLFLKEVKRLEFDLKGTWRISQANKDFKLCSSYPRLLLVPCCISDDKLQNISTFRSSRRLPAVVWRHKLNSAVIARCSQPEVGWLGWRNGKDEQLLKAIADACAFDRGEQRRRHNLSISSDSSTTPSSPEGSHEEVSLDEVKKILIVDARSYTSAVTNRARGGGCECPEYYPCAEIQFMSLGNIHAIRKSFQALRQLCAAPADMPNWLGTLERTLWLQHLSGLLYASITVCIAVEVHGRPVLVHCSDGWDRTPQIVATAQLCLDPYYRTVEGFRTLVEREWLNFGHKFADRLGHGLGSDDPNERCPVFLQWLDCVYQIHRQFPCSFEFSMGYLIKLAQHSHSCLFGSFLCNTDKERIENKVFNRTYSVWSFLSGPMYKNPLYLPNKERVLWPTHNVRDLSLWKEVYLGSLGNQNLSDYPPSTNDVNQESKNGSLIKTRSYGDLMSIGGQHGGLTRRSSDPNMIVDSHYNTHLMPSDILDNETMSDSGILNMVNNHVDQAIAIYCSDNIKEMENLTDELNNCDLDDSGGGGGGVCVNDSKDESDVGNGSSVGDNNYNVDYDNGVDGINISYDSENMGNDTDGDNDNGINHTKSYEFTMYNDKLLEDNISNRNSQKYNSKLLFNQSHESDIDSSLIYTHENSSEHLDNGLVKGDESNNEYSNNNIIDINNITHFNVDDIDGILNKNHINYENNNDNNNEHNDDRTDRIDKIIINNNNTDAMLQSIDLNDISSLNNSPLHSSSCAAQNLWYGSVETSTDTLVPIEQHNISSSNNNNVETITHNVNNSCSSGSEYNMKFVESETNQINNQDNIDNNNIDDALTYKTHIKAIFNDTRSQNHQPPQKIMPEVHHPKQKIYNSQSNHNKNNHIIKYNDNDYINNNNNNNNTTDYNNIDEIILLQPYASFSNKTETVNGSRNDNVNNIIHTTSSHRRRRNSSNSKPEISPNKQFLNGSNNSISPIATNLKFSISGVRSLPLTPSGTTDRPPVTGTTIVCPDGLAHALSEQNLRLQQIVYEHKLHVEALERELTATRVALTKRKCINCSSQQFLIDDPNTFNDNVENVSMCSWEALEDRSAPSSGASSTQPTNVLWVPDHAVSRCTGCQTEFWLGRRKHHCRLCGHIFCADCSEYRAAVPDEKFYTPVRLCSSCYATISSKTQQTSLTYKKVQLHNRSIINIQQQQSQYHPQQQIQQHQNHLQNVINNNNNNNNNTSAIEQHCKHAAAVGTSNNERENQLKITTATN